MNDAVSASGRVPAGEARRDITERKRAEEERLAHLRFFESMDRINRAMQGTDDLGQMMSAVLDAMLSIFDCDRASLVYPCDPEATSWKAPMERTRPEYPGALAMGLEVPMDPDVVRVFRTLQASSGPVQFGPQSAHPLPSAVSRRFGSQSQIAMALYPKADKPWMFVQQQCSRQRVWTAEEERLFEEIGRRLTDSLTSLQTHRDLRESEARMRALFENSMVGILLTAPDGRVFAANPAACRMFGRTEAEICRLGRSGLVNRRDARVNALVRERGQKGCAVGEMSLVRADGTCFPAQVVSAVFETAEGPRTSMVIEDISERKLTEARIRDFSRELLTVREEEKRRISAVLHHDVGSFTVGVTAHLNAVEEDLRKGKYKEALAALKKGHRLFMMSVKRLKTLAVELRPPDLDILGLPAAIRQYFSLLTKETSLRIHFTDATYGMAIPPETQTVLFRIVQESLNNVAKHARARQVRVQLSAPRKTLRLSIVDDGKGFDPVRVAAKPGMRLGLRIAQEMVAALGGEFVVDASPGRGTTVLVTVPRGGPKT
jgi:PAS domain S-box-containing protein